METAAGTARPSGPPSRPPWRLTDLISRDALQSIQDTFAQAFGLPTVIVDTAAENATTITHRLSFCEDLTRTTAVGGRRCSECDMCAMRDAADASQPVIFECWNGLFDCAIPIAPKGHVLGYFLCGQILTGEPDRERYAATAEALGVEPSRYLDALADVKVVPFPRYEASVQSMHVLAQMIADQAAASIDSLQMLEDARRAKEETAALVEELDTILEALREIGSQPDYHATLASIADNLDRLIPWDSCVIYMLGDDGHELVPVVVRDPFPAAVADHRPRRGDGIIGKAALGGGGRRVLDMTREPDFEPIPGVPSEPESALVMPMRYRGTVTGVIVLSRFERRTFTDHDLRVLDVFSAQASVSIQVAKLASENAQRLREERALSRLRLATAQRTSAEAILRAAGEAGLDLLGADAGALRVADPLLPEATVLVGVEEEGARALAELDLAVGRQEPQVVALERGSALVVPFDDGDTVAVAVFVRRDDARWDMRLAGSLAVQAGLGLQKVGMHERERRSRLQYQQLSELATGLTTAGDVAEVRERLLEHTPGVLFADACFIALLDQGPDAIAVELRDGAASADRVVRLQGGARLASVRLRGEPRPDRSVFDTWSQEVFRLVGADRGLTTWLAEPLPLPVGSLGGLFVGWRSPPAEPSAEQRRILAMVAGAAGTTFARFAAHLATDSTLRDRLLELEALTRLAQRTSGLAHRRAIVEELLAAVRRVGVGGAVYGTAGPDRVRIERAAGLDPEGIAAIARRLEALDSLRERRRVRADPSGSAITVIPMAVPGEGDAFLAGTTPGEQDEQRDRVIATLARYAAVALENAELHDRQRDAISRLERQHVETAGQYDRLERILAVHDTLALAVLEGRGLDSVVRSLGEFLDAEMLVLAGHGRSLAEWPPEPGIGWRPRVQPGQPPRTLVELDGDRHVIAAPAVLDGRTRAWIIARVAVAPGDVERAAVEYAALLVALELLRERTGLEVEARLRAGLLEELFDGTAAEDPVIERAHAFGYDLRQPSRVFLAEEASGGDHDALHGLVLDCAERWASQNLVALNGNVAVMVVPELPSDGDAERRFEDELRDAADAADGAVNIAVGSSCERVGDYRDSHLAARRGLDLLRLLGRPGETFSFREDTLESVLLQSTRVDVVVRFIERFVAPLDAYDCEHTSELRRTLEVFYDAGGTLEETARRLHVHVSTLRYRLKKASELLGVDVKAGPAALDVQVALKAARVIAARRT